MNKKINKSDKIKELKSKIIKILKQKGIKKAGIFGSYARGEQKKGSDIDILIEPPKGMGMEFIGLNLELEKELGLKVDLISYNGLNRHIKGYILADEVKII